MDIAKNVEITRDMLEKDIDAMSATYDLDVLVDAYRRAKQNLELIYLGNFKKISDARRLKEVSGRD